MRQTRKQTIRLPGTTPVRIGIDSHDGPCSRSLQNWKTLCGDGAEQVLEILWRHLPTGERRHDPELLTRTRSGSWFKRTCIPPGILPVAPRLPLFPGLAEAGGLEQ